MSWFFFMQTRWCKIIEPLVWLSWSFLSRLEIKYVMTSCLTSRLPATSNTKKVLSIYWTLCLINWAEILYVGLKSKFIIPLWLTSTPWVYPLMNFQMTWFTILFVTFFTCIRFFICVNPLMNFKVTWLSKLFVACSTFIRFFTYVNPHMSCFELANVDGRREKFWIWRTWWRQCWGGLLKMWRGRVGRLGGRETHIWAAEKAACTALTDGLVFRQNKIFHERIV